MRFWFVILVHLELACMCVLLLGVDGGESVCQVLQELGSDGDFRQMASHKRCHVCGYDFPRVAFKTVQWQLPRNRTCKTCESPQTAQPVAAAAGTHEPASIEQHGVLGQPAATGGSAAAAGVGAVGESSPCCQPMMCGPVWSILDSRV